MAFYVYRYAFDESFVSKLLLQIDYQKFREHKVGDCNLANNKIQQTSHYFLEDPVLLKYIDEYFYANFFQLVCSNFPPPLFRQNWKISKF